MSDAVLTALIMSVPTLISSVVAAITSLKSLQQTKQNRTELQQTNEKVDLYHESVNGKMEKLLDVVAEKANLIGRRDLKAEQDASDARKE